MRKKYENIRKQNQNGGTSFRKKLFYKNVLSLNLKFANENIFLVYKLLQDKFPMPEVPPVMITVSPDSLQFINHKSQIINHKS